MINHAEENAQLRERSGSRNCEDPFVSLIYTLLRDHVTPSALEGLVREVTAHGAIETEYTNGWLHAYAEDLVARLRECEAKPHANKAL